MGGFIVNEAIIKLECRLEKYFQSKKKNGVSKR